MSISTGTKIKRQEFKYKCLLCSASKLKRGVNKGNNKITELRTIL